MSENEATPLVMRKLAPVDTFTMMRILAQMRVKEVLLTLFKRWQEINKLQREQREQREQRDESEPQVDLQVVGMAVVAEMLEVLMGNMYLAQDDINRLLAQLCGVTVARIESLEFIEYNNLLGEFLSKRELKDFFTSMLSSKAFQNLR